MGKMTVASLQKFFFTASEKKVKSVKYNDLDIRT